MMGALLAGGSSTRMGRDKCLLEIEGRPLWQRQCGLLSDICEEVCVVAPVRPAWCPRSLRWLPDAAPDRGPIAGLCAALENSTSPLVLALAVDLPDMSRDYLAALAARNRGIVPEMDGFYQPLSAVYPTAALPSALAHLDQPDRSFQSLLRELIAAGKICAVPVAGHDRPLFRNLNTPED